MFEQEMNKEERNANNLINNKVKLVNCGQLVGRFYFPLTNDFQMSIVIVFRILHSSRILLRYIVTE